LNVGGVLLSRCTDGQPVETGFSNGNPVTKTWIAAAVTFEKTFEVGPFTSPAGTVCFTLSRDGGLPPGVPSPQTTAVQCKTVAASVDFTWEGLVDGDYTISEDSSLVTPAGAYIDISDIEFTVAEDCTSVPPVCVQASATPTPFDLGTFNDPLRQGRLQVLKLLGPAPGTPWTGPDVDFYVCQNSPKDTAAVQTPCDAGNADEILTVPADGNPAVSGLLDEAYYTVCEDVPAGYTASPADCQYVQVLAGGAAAEAQVTFTNTPPDEACTPGYWQGPGNGLLRWDEAPPDPQWGGLLGPSHPNPFQTTDLFGTFFSTGGLASTMAPFTMEQLIDAGKVDDISGGDIVRKSARFAIAAALNAEWGMNFAFADGVAVQTAWNNAAAAGTLEAFETLFHDLTAAFGPELECPIPPLN
jgi:hypothetical protein